jgi:hypothetical protein
MSTTTTQPTVAWLLEADGTVTPLIEARRSVWPGSAYVTFANGTKMAVNARNVLAGDDLDRRYFA